MTEENTQLKEVLQRIERAKQFVRPWKENIERWRRLYNLNHYKSKPKQREVQYNDPTFTNTIDLAVGIMLANRLRWHAFGSQPSDEAQHETSQIEKLLDGTLMVNDEREEASQLYQLYLHFCRDGGAAFYSIFDPVLAKRFKFKKDIPDAEQGSRSVWAFRENPLRVQIIDPMSLITLPGGPKRWLMLGRVEQRTVLDVEVQYGVRIAKYSSLSEETKAITEDEFIDAWDYTFQMTPMKGEDGKVVQDDGGANILVPEAVVRNTILFAGEAVRGPRIMRDYEDLPYTVQFFKPVGKGPEEWHSLISVMESSVALLERTFNRRAHQIDVFTGLPIVTKTQLGRAVKLDPGLYNSVTISTDEEIGFPTWQGNPPDLNNQVDFLRSRIQQSGFSDVMFGSGVNQVAGYALSQLGDQNRIRLEQPMAHLELLLGTWAKKALNLLNAFAKGAQVRVYGQQRGEDYIEYVGVADLLDYSVRAEIRPTFPNEETRKSAIATQAKGILSEHTIMERYYDIEQPDDEEEWKIIEAVSRHPVVVHYTIMNELTKRAQAGNDVAQKTLQQLEAGMIPGAQPGRPKEPNNPEQLTGTQSPTGQPVPQALGSQPGASEGEALANTAPNMAGGI